MQNIERLEAFVQPLLQSPLVGEGPAFDAQVAVAKSLPGKLGRHALSVATALQVVELHRSGKSVSLKYLYVYYIFKKILCPSVVCHMRKLDHQS